MDVGPLMAAAIPHQYFAPENWYVFCQKATSFKLLIIRNFREILPLIKLALIIQIDLQFGFHGKS